MELAAGLSHDDLDKLRRLHEAGVIHLDALRVASDPRLIEWTYDDLRRWLITQGYQSATEGRRYSTVEFTGQYLRQLEGLGREPAEVPVQLRPPNEESWLRHVEYRIGSGDSPSVLNDGRKALQRLLRFLELPVWPCLEKPYSRTPEPWTLPPDHLIPRFWMDRLHRNPHVSRTLQHVLHFGFHVGVRPPSELLLLDVDDVDFTGNTVVVTEWKKKGKRRLLHDVEPFVLSGQNTKSLQNYLTYVRPKYAKPGEAAFFVDPRSGERWRPAYLAEALSAAGKAIWPPFRGYTMRRWCATQRLIASDFDLYYVARWLGDTVSTVESHYIDHARAMAARGKVALKRFQ